MPRHARVHAEGLLYHVIVTGSGLAIKHPDKTFTYRLYYFCFVHPAQALLNSTLQLLALDASSRVARSVAQAICG